MSTRIGKYFCVCHWTYPVIDTILLLRPICREKTVLEEMWHLPVSCINTEVSEEHRALSTRIGQKIGNYRLARFLGQGGFAEVYLAEHVHLGTQAAIKLLQMQVTDEVVQQFTHEARLIAALKSPHIVQVLDFGIEQAIPFLVMDYAPNGSLRQASPRGTRLSLPTLVSYIKQM